VCTPRTVRRQTTMAACVRSGAIYVGRHDSAPSPASPGRAQGYATRAFGGRRPHSSERNRRAHRGTSGFEGGVPRAHGMGAETETKQPPGDDVGNRSLAEELDALVGETRASGAGAGLHVVAFSGGVDSSLAAYLVERAFGSGAGDAGDTAGDAGTGTGARVCVAAIGVSPALPASQLATARQVAAAIGIPLWEVPTDEGRVPEYVANEVRRQRGPRSLSHIALLERKAPRTNMRSVHDALGGPLTTTPRMPTITIYFHFSARSQTTSMNYTTQLEF